MADYRFGLIVAIEPDGSIMRPVERVESKYTAARLCREYAKKTPGTLYVAMETHEAYRSEPRVEMIFLEYPPKLGDAMVPVLPDHELADLI